MITETLRNEFAEYFHHELPEIVKVVTRECREEYDHMPEGLNAYDRKVFTYRMMADHCRPKVFANSSFYCDIGTQMPRSDGADYEGDTPGAWNFVDHQHMFFDVLDEQQKKQIDLMCQVPLIKLCGPVGDEKQHFSFRIETILEMGLSGVLDRVHEMLKGTLTEEQAQYLHATEASLLCMKTICDRFEEEALRLAQTAIDETEKQHYLFVADAAAHCPWNAPRTLFEALNCFAFFQLVVSSLEGVALETMGRIDTALTPFYERDLAEKRLTRDEAYQLFTEFCYMWNARVFETEYELGTFDPSFAYTVGGCDEQGEPFCSDVTMMLLRINRELKLIYPKLKCRYSKDSPEAYLSEINVDIIDGRTNSMYQNDDTTIPALVRRGVSLEDARNYGILGCWEPVVDGSADEHCSYLNLLKILELSVFDDFENDCGLTLRGLENAESFEDIYDRLLQNIRTVIHTRCEIVRKSRTVWKNVDPILLLSMVQPGCLEKARSYPDGGMRYYVDEIICSGFVNVVDSLLAIRSVVYDRKLTTLKELFAALSENWSGSERNEEIHRAVLASPFYADESKVSCELAARLNHDLVLIADSEKELWGGKVVIGHMIYREMDEWCKTIRATPDGRSNGDWFTRGYAPSFLHPLKTSTAVLNTLRNVATDENSGNSVLNLVMTFKKDELRQLNDYVRTTAMCHVQSLQLNNVTREELEDALVSPEHHRDLVVRVCGYSARFIALEKETQTEFLHRNFYR